MTITEVVKTAVAKAVQLGALWLTNGPASILAEPIPAGVLNEQARLQKPPAMIAAAEILPENLPQAWQNEEATGLSIATALSQKFGQTLPWKTVSDVISASLHARFTQLNPLSGEWPCEFPSKAAKIHFEPHTYTYVERGGTRHAAESLGVDEHSVVKTLVMEAHLSDGKKRAVLVLMHGDCEVSTNELARTLQVKGGLLCPRLLSSATPAMFRAA